MARHVVVVTSTLPASDTDSVPAFVKDQVIALKKAYPDLDFTILAPHDAHSNTQDFTVCEAYNEYRFHYFWPFRFEKVAGHGIMPTLKKNPVYYLLIPFLFIAEFFALLKLTRRIKPEIIYAHWFTPQGVSAGIVSAITKVPFVYTSHSSDVAVLHRIPVLGKLLVQHFSGKADAITVVSKRSLEKLKSFFSEDQWQGVASKVAVIPMGVHVITKKSKESVNSHAQTILFLGRLVEKKGVQYLLSAFAQLTNKRDDCKLVIAGDGPLLAELKQKAKTLGIGEYVEFLGYVSGTLKESCVNTASIYVVPSIIASDGDAEGLPVSLLEGLAAGKVCIASNESGADDIIENGRNGFLVAEKDIDALSAALETSLDMPEMEQETMRKNAMQTATKFSWQNIAEQHYQFLFRKL